MKWISRGLHSSRLGGSILRLNEPRRGGFAWNGRYRPSAGPPSAEASAAEAEGSRPRGRWASAGRLIALPPASRPTNEVRTAVSRVRVMRDWHRSRAAGMLWAVGILTLSGAGQGEGQSDVPLFDNIGSHSYTVTVESERAQDFFDQGLRLYYAFNHAESIRAFREGARIDPTCAMCFWGIGLAYGPNINAAMDTASAVAAYEASVKALSLSGRVTPRERALIEALASRYAKVPPVDRGYLDMAYATAMRGVVERFPDDPEAAVLYAEALMDLSPWDYWTRAGEPREDTPRILFELERVIGVNPHHPGACHFYIHAVEAAHPHQAVDCAERLARLMPGAGHLVHMPAHIYIRVGRWADAIRANEHAVHADESYIRDQRPESGVYTAGYYPHNYHFLAFAAAMAGQSSLSIESAKRVTENVTPEVAFLAPDLEGLLAYHHLALATFGRWREILDLPVPPREVPVSWMMAHFARGVAFATLGEQAAAGDALRIVRETANRIPEGVTTPIGEIAVLVLEGEIAARGGRLDEALRAFEAASAAEDGMSYMEPPLWFYPVRHSLGRVLLDLERPIEAERVYAEDLARFPENGWSLIGLERALRDQGRTDAANAVRRRFEKSWAGADVRPATSRF
jgi:tetratricopeptide (TPR) repeat protein